MDIFSPPKPPAPPAPPTRDEIIAEDTARRARENIALRDSIWERKVSSASRGRQSMINSGLGIPS